MRKSSYPLWMLILAVSAWPVAGSGPRAQAGPPATRPADRANPADKVILTEAGVWRSHITWMKPVLLAAEGVKPARMWMSNRMQTEEIAPPPAGWMLPDYDDSRWAYWREIHGPETLKIKTSWRGPEPAAQGEETGVRLYEPAQYGLFRSPFVGLFCARSRFRVEEPADVKDLKLAVEFRGGAVAYLNGQEIGRAYLPKEGKIDYNAVADIYPTQAFYNPLAKDRTGQPMPPPGARWSSAGPWGPADAEALKLYNSRIRRMDIEIPAGMLRPGVNVLALEVHRAPWNAAGEEKVEGDWSLCGLVSVELRGAGAVQSALERPKGFHVWNAGVLTRISPFGSISTGRVYQGGFGLYPRSPLSWGDPFAPLQPIRLVAPRNGWATGQVGVGCDRTIRSLKATAGDLRRQGGAERIAASAVDVRFMIFPDEPYSGVGSPSMSFIDALYEAAPAEVVARAGGAKTDSWLKVIGEGSATTWVDAGAATAVWIRVRVPADAAPGQYHGTLHIAAEGHEPVSAPVELRVADWTAPKPTDFVTHVGTPISLDTLALWYKTPLWSEAHWRLIDRTLAHMGQLGGKAVFLPLKANTCWLRNEQSMVYWIRQPDGSFRHDYRVLDRYLDLVQQHAQPEVYCLYAVDFSERAMQAEYSLLDPATGNVELAKGPDYAPTAEAAAFWKPVIDGVIERLLKRGINRESIMIGLAWEGAGGEPKQGINPKATLFRDVIPPGMKVVQIAHYGGGGKPMIPYGYCMSVWGNASSTRSKVFGARDLPFIIAQHYRADARWDVRPGSHPATLRFCVENTLRSVQGIGPLGLNFWHLPADPARRLRGGPLEGGGADNLSMSTMGSGFLLAPGPDGPISTARFEMLREGVQECEARMVVEQAVRDEAGRGRLGEALAKRCADLLKERDRQDVIAVGEAASQGEGWSTFESSGWEDRALDLFNCAGEVTRALK